MKILALLCPLLLLAACAQPAAEPPMAAEPPPPAAPAEPTPAQREAVRKEWMAACANWGNVAKRAMEARQYGMSMRELLEATSAEGENETTTKIIMKAYDAPRYGTERHQQREIVDFENQVYSACLKEVGFP